MLKKIVFIVICLLVFALPVFSSSQQSGNDTVKFGLYGPFTGPAVEVGDNIKKAGILAIEEINADGGILGKQVELVLGDTESKPASGVSAFERLINKDGVILLTGGLHSDVALATMDISAKYHIPQISSGPVSGEIEKKFKADQERFKYFFKSSPSSSVYGKAWRDFFNYLEIKDLFVPQEKTIAYIYERTSWGEALAESVDESLVSAGWKTVAKEAVNIDDSNYLSLLSKIKSLNPDVVWTAQTSAAAGASLIKQYRDANISSLFTVSYLPGNPSYIELSGAASDGVIWNVIPAVIPNLEITKHFEEAFENRWGSKPTENAAIQYSLMYIIKKAYEKAGTFDPDSFAEAFINVDYKSPIGRYKYSRDTHTAQAGQDFLPIFTYKIENGVSYIIWPEIYAQSKF